MMTMMIERPGPSTTLRPNRLPAKNVAHVACSLVDQHSHFHGRAHQFQFAQHDNTLTVRGCVPSFYLKQVLQTLLKNLEGIRIDNQVDVVSPEGLSSVRREGV